MDDGSINFHQTSLKDLADSQVNESLQAHRLGLSAENADQTSIKKEKKKQKKQK